MLGRMRRCSLSSLEVLEMERTHSKILKDDSLSIYENTLMKLKQGSRHDLRLLTPEQSARIDTGHSFVSVSSDEASMMHDCSSAVASRTSSDCQSVSISNVQHRGNLSILYMFSRYESSRKDSLSSPNEDEMAIENTNSSGRCITEL